MASSPCMFHMVDAFMLIRRSSDGYSKGMSAYARQLSIRVNLKAP